MHECEGCGVVTPQVQMYEFALGEEYEEHGDTRWWCPDCVDSDYEPATDAADEDWDEDEDDNLE